MFIFDPPTDSPLATSVPCYVEVSIGGGVEVRMYGPFPSMNDARDWCEKHSPIPFKIIPLRRIDKERTYNDFFAPQTSDIEVLIDDMYDINKYHEWNNNK